jgi:hypothetical protein
MAGELYTQSVQVGKQVSAQAAVAATRRVYVMSPSITRERESRPKAFATGDRMPVRAHRSGPAIVAGSIQTGCVADELLELLEATFGPAAISTPSGATNARRHVYTPGDPSYITVEHKDGARIWQGFGMRCNGMNVSLSVAGEVTVTFPLFGLERQPLDAMTAGLPERTPPTTEGWEARFYIENLGGTPGTTRVDDVLAAADIAFTNNLGRKWLASNRREASKLPAGVIGLTGSLRMEASEAQALTEYLNWEADTYRLFRLEIGNNDVIDAGTNEVQSITVDAAGGTFTVTSTAGGSSETTAAIPWNATPAQILAALLALPSYVYGDLATGGGPGATAPLTVTHQGRYSGMNVPQFTTTATGLTGGASTAVVATTTPGVAGFKKLVWFDVPIAFTGVDTNQEGEGTREYSFPFTYVYDPTLASAIKVTCQTSRTSAF